LLNCILNKKITINFTDNRPNKEQTQSFHYDGGITEFIHAINTNKDIIHNEIYIEKDIDNCNIELVFQYTDSYTENMYSFSFSSHEI
jgi:DNA gyrase subunit B